MQPTIDGTFDSSGVPIHYQVFGEGEPMVLVHGFASSIGGNWAGAGWIETLTPLRQVVALDCRGHGESGKPHDVESYSGDAMMDDVVRLMDHLSIEKADLFGYSMGAGISLRLLIDHESRFRSAVLGGVGNVIARSTRGRPGLGEAMLAETADEVKDPVGKAFRAFAEANGNDLKALAACQGAQREPLNVARLAEVSIPVMLVVGENDVLAPDPAALAEAIAGARLLTVPARDHLTVVPDKRFKEAVVGFLGGSVG
jgi:pimeloyl-ACP methyl ester carboxylesterase